MANWTYVIYHIETTIMHRGTSRSRPQRWRSRGAASAEIRRAQLDPTWWTIAEETHFHQHIEKQETKVNLLSKLPFTQPVNTPACCDPSTETYHSM
jgi:hypothetical protein